MAVPPKGAEIVFNAVLSSLADIEYPFIESNIIEINSLLDKPHYTIKAS